MTHPYNAFVEEFADLLGRGRQLPLGGFPVAEAPHLGSAAPVTLVFSPHPDDECIIGALPLRLRREGGHRVVVAAVTQGSKAERQAERFEEMRGACGFLGFDLVAIREHGLSGITPAQRESGQEGWAVAVTLAAGLLAAHRPSVVVMPHALDGHPTHQGTHFLVLDALRELGSLLQCQVVTAEFWAAHAQPNLMVESSCADVADLVAAISFHRGEVLRNPYHALLPAWMADNVRRGSELVGTPGAAAEPFTFATLYQASNWDGESLRPLAKSSLPAGLQPFPGLGSCPCA